MIEWLDSTALRLLGVDVTWLEVLADITGAATVWLAARERVATWPVGIVNSALFLVLFLDARLYADTALQVAFIVLGVYGWIRWNAGRSGDGSHAARELPVRRTSAREWAALGLVTAVGIGAWTWWLTHHTDSPVPFWDAAVLVLSLVATYGQARKLVESWFVWITVDVISVPLYLSRDLVPTAILFGGFGVLCVMGLQGWRRSLAASEATQPATAVVVG